jgi:uncharacterized protein (DUF305 family)
MPTLRLALVLALLAAPALAQTQGHGHHAAPAAAPDPVTAAFLAANDRMHQDMAVEFTGDADVDFARAMIPHHQGAIDMAAIILEHGDDPELRALAEAIVAAQEAEIAMLRAWLERQGH